jgi:FkbM family methyltransferase
MTRLYPFLSGCGTLANHRLIDLLADKSDGDAWAEVEGGRLSVALDDYVGRAAYFVGDLDRKISAIIDRYVRPGDTVLDVGANIGLVTLRLSKRVGSSGTVHAFEPNPAIADRLAASLRASNARNVKLHRIALGDVRGTAQLHIPNRNAGMASLVDGRFVDNETCEVAVCCLDDLELGTIDFIKIDVEGFEENVLRGFSRALQHHPPKIILFEQNDETGQSICMLQKAGYRIQGVSKTLLRLDLRPVSEWSPRYHDYVAVRA